MRMDSQRVEIIGRNWLVTELYRCGLEVARPERDHGIDLIAFLDLDKSGRFIGRPIQMKASSAQSFGVWRKLKKFPGLLIAYVWNLEKPLETACYCLTYDEALAVADLMKWTTTKSWREKDTYVTNSPSQQLVSALDQYKMTADRWRSKLSGAHRDGKL